MAVLLDTGVLIRWFEPNAKEHDQIASAIRRLIEQRESLFVAVQNIAELWNVSTRPIQHNGRGESFRTVEEKLAAVERIAAVVAESEQSYLIWKQLVVENSVSGVQVHDARLASVMIAREIPRVLTLNERDFRRYSQIVAVTPSQVLAG